MKRWVSHHKQLTSYSSLAIEVFNIKIEQQAQDFQRTKLLSQNVTDLKNPSRDTDWMQNSKPRINSTHAVSDSKIWEVQHRTWNQLTSSCHSRNGTAHIVGAKVTCTRGTHRPLRNLTQCNLPNRQITQWPTWYSAGLESVHPLRSDGTITQRPSGSARMSLA